MALPPIFWPRALHDEIKAITDQPVKLVIDENGQGHAMLGNNYWIEQGVPVLAHVDAAEEFEDTQAQALAAMQGYNRDRAEGTVPMGPTLTFEDSYDASMGDFRIEVLHLGPAHSPGDTQVWLPDQRLVIAGDIAFHERMLPIFSGICTSCWIETWETAFEPLGALYVIPGHGHPTNMDQVRRYTRDYLVYLRGKIADHLDEGGDLAGAYYVDQSPYAHLDTYEELADEERGPRVRGNGVRIMATPPVCDFGWKAPDFTLPGTDGTDWSLSRVAGPKGTLVMFICNHCPYVQAILPRIIRDAKDLEHIGVGVVAISSNDAAAYPQDGFRKMQSLALHHGFPFPYLYDETQEVAKAYGAVCTPDFFGFNADLGLQYRGRLDASGSRPAPEDARRELFEAMKQVAETGQGPRDQVASMGCSIKWNIG